MSTLIDNRPPFLTLFILLSSFLPLLAQTEAEQLPNDRLLVQLDEVIAHKAEYQARRAQQADSLRTLASHQSGMERIATLEQLYDTYLHFETGKALEVTRWQESLPEVCNDRQQQILASLNEARSYGLMGLYNKAFEITGSLRHADFDRDSRLRYYNTMHAILDWRADYARHAMPQLADTLLREAAIYHDSLFCLEPVPANRSIIRTNLYYDTGEYQACIDTLLALMPQFNADQRIFAYSRLAQAYGKVDQPDLQLHYLILTAIADIRAGITEYMALPLLAEQLYLRGDDRRAYDYLSCALQDATICKSNLRTLEASVIFPIIEQANNNRLAREKRNGNLIIFGLILIALILGIGLFFVVRLNKKLQTVRLLVAKANGELKTANIKLQQANRELIASAHIKEEYLMKFVNRSRDYLTTIESTQRQILKQVQARQFDDLTRKLKSSDFIDEEQEKFYTAFDETFLTLYPDFVQRFNTLLKPEAAIEPKRGELLTTELRIFALIRMGETDSTKIAKFLNYSLTTIYNYRSRVRNNAKGDKETFEEQVMRL